MSEFLIQINQHVSSKLISMFGISLTSRVGLDVSKKNVIQWSIEPPEVLKLYHFLRNVNIPQKNIRVWKMIAPYETSRQCPKNTAVKINGYVIKIPGKNVTKRDIVIIVKISWKLNLSHNDFHEKSDVKIFKLMPLEV